MSRRWELSRRTLLRGTGVAVGLPLLEAMVPAKAFAASSPAPRRFVGLFGLPTGALGVSEVGGEQNCVVAPWTQPGQGQLLTTNPYMKHFFDAGVASLLAGSSGVINSTGSFFKPFRQCSTNG